LSSRLTAELFDNWHCIDFKWFGY